MSNKQKNKKNSKEIVLITVIAVLIVEAVGIVICKSFDVFSKINTVNDFALIIASLMLSGYIVGVIVYYGICNRLEKEEISLKEDELKKHIYRYLNTNTFKEVFFLYKGNGITGEVVEEILKEGRYRYFAVLLTDGTIMLEVKDKNNNTFYATLIQDYHYFVANFSFKQEEKVNV